MSTVKLPFSKYHGNGNDFIIVDYQNLTNPLPASWFVKNAPLVCDRHKGIGADGILTLIPHQDRFLMRVINADGSIAKNCGNGLRCAADYLCTTRLITKVAIDLDSHVYYAQKLGDTILVAMGICTITPQPDVHLTCTDMVARVALGDMGNLHLIILLERPIVYSEAVKELLQTGIATPDMNLGFLYQDEHGRYCSQVFERGVGFTNSCGTGASAAAAFLTFLYPHSLRGAIPIVQSGGCLTITAEIKSLDKERGSFLINQSGGATAVFTGIFEAEDNC